MKRLSAWWNHLKERQSELVAEFGVVAVTTYLTIFVGTWVSFWAALRMGFEVESAAGGATTIGAAYVATKVAQPARIGATLVLTPFVAGILHWIKNRGRQPAESGSAASDGKG